MVEDAIKCIKSIIKQTAFEKSRFHRLEAGWINNFSLANHMHFTVGTSVTQISLTLTIKGKRSYEMAIHSDFLCQKK